MVAAVIAALALVLPVWAAALIVAGVLFTVAAVLAMIGRTQTAQATPPVPRQAAQSVKQDITTITERAHR
nr:phage holin family protein [Actinomadura rudentiformis]